MSEIQTSRFFTYNDPRLNEVILELPKYWWSRPYEYAWASLFAESEHTILDAACGLCHPFKFYLCTFCQNVYGCDLDERILSKRHIVMDMFRVFGLTALDFPFACLEKPILSRQDISNTTYNNAMFDRVFCISVLEHLSEAEILKTLVEFKRILKRQGLAVITFDNPELEVERFNIMLEKSGLTYAGEVILDLPRTALSTDLFSGYPKGHYCFRALLKKHS